MVILLAYWRRDGSGVVLFPYSGSYEIREPPLPKKHRLVKFSSDNTFEIHSVVGGLEQGREERGYKPERGGGKNHIATLRKQQRTLTIHGEKRKQNGRLTPTSDPTD